LDINNHKFLERVFHIALTDFLRWATMLIENTAGKNAFPDYPVRHPKKKIAYPANGW
jgi:hypothetical protein